MEIPLPIAFLFSQRVKVSSNDGKKINENMNLIRNLQFIFYFYAF